MAAITQGTAEIRLRLNTDDARRSFHEFVAGAKSDASNVGATAGGVASGGGGVAAGAGVAAGSFIGNVLRGGAAIVGGMTAPLFGQSASDLSTPWQVAGKAMAEEYGFGTLARNAAVGQTAADRTAHQLGIAAGFMDAGQIAQVYGMNKQMTKLEAKGQNAVYNNPYIQSDLKMEAAGGMENAVNTVIDALGKFANELKATPGRVQEIGQNLGWW